MNNIVGTTKAAFLLNISVSRVKVLLQQNRIKGARKEGLVWKITLIGGLPRIKKCDRSLKGTWRTRRQEKNTKIHVNKPQIDRNRWQETLEPVIKIRQGYRKTYCHALEIKGNCRVVYQPNNPLSCGAVVWIETTMDTVVVPQIFTSKKVEIL